LHVEGWVFNDATAKEHYKEAESYLKLNQLSLALQEINESPNIDDENNLYLCTRGRIYFALGQQEKHNESFEKAKQDFLFAYNHGNQDNYLVLKMLALTSMKLQQYGEGIEYIEKAMRIKPTDGKLIVIRAQLVWAKGDKKEAITFAKKSVELLRGVNDNKTASNIYVTLGSYYFDMEDVVSAEFYLKKAMQIFPSHSKVVYNQLGWFYATCPNPSIRDGNKAIEYAGKAVEIEEEIHSLDTLAAAYAETGNFSKAVEIERKVVMLCDKPEKKKKFMQLLEAYQKQQTYVQFKETSK
jgi:tetratricopeptide (TPR) repeat protein